MSVNRKPIDAGVIVSCESFPIVAHGGDFYAYLLEKAHYDMFWDHLDNEGDEELQRKLYSGEVDYMERVSVVQLLERYLRTQFLFGGIPEE